MLTAEDIKSALKLKPLAKEGGYFCESYRSAIYYLLTPDTFSTMP